MQSFNITTILSDGLSVNTALNHKFAKTFIFNSKKHICWKIINDRQNGFCYLCIKICI